MAMTMRMRSSSSFLRKALVSDSSISSQLSNPIPNPNQRNYTTSAPANEVKVKVKANALDKVESELVDLVEATKKSPTFLQFTKDLSVLADTRLKAINEISGQAKFSDVTKNFLAVLVGNRRLRHTDTIAKRFSE